MSNAYIEILDTENSVLGTVYVSENNDFPLALNDKISNINNVLRGNTSSSSKTFRTPATRELNNLLEYLYNSNIVDNKDMKNVKPCRLIVDGIQFYNYNKIKCTDIIQRNGRPIEYEWVLYGENYEWVDAAKDAMITDFDYYDGTTDLINYTKTKLNTDFYTNYDSGYDYWWSLKNYGGWKNGTNASVEDFRPDIYIKSIERKFFARNGYTLSSDFKDGSIFKKLIFPFIGKGFVVDPDVVKDNRVVVERTVPQGNFTDVLISMPTEREDISNLWSTDTFTASVRGVYRFSGYVDFQTYSTYGNFIGGIQYKKNGVLRTLYDTSGANAYSSSFGNSFQFISFDFGIFLDPSDTIQFRASVDPTLVATPGVFSFINIRAASLAVILGSEIVEGSSFRIKDVFPNNISVLDVINGCTEMFNLYWKTDNRLKKIYCEPRNTFYKGFSDAIDWTSKLDIASGYTLSFLTDYKRNWSFRYADDSNDKLVAEENKKNNRVLAEQKLELPSRFAKGEERAGTDFFAPTISKPAIEIAVTGIQDAPVIPTFHNNSPQPPTYSNDFLPRILYQEGMVQKNSAAGVTQKWKFSSRSTSTIDTMSYVPLAYMSDGLAGVGENLMFCDGTVDGDGLFKTYWDETFQILETGEVLAANFRLKSTELSTIDLRYPVYFSEPAELKGYWIIDSLGDYKPHDIDLVPAKLVKVESRTPTTLTPISTDLGVVEDLGGNFSQSFLNAHVQSTGNNSALSPVTTMNANSGNVSLNNGNVVWGMGLIGIGSGQTVLGKFNQASETDKFVIGAGNSDSDRANVISIDENDNLKVFGGQIFYTDGSGNIMPIYSTDENGNVNFVYQK